MGFSNEYLTDDEKKLISETEHYALTHYEDGHYVCLADTCTVDRKKKIWLLSYAFDYDINPKIDGMPFVLFWGNINKNSMIELSLWYVGKERNKQIKEKYSTDLLKYWSIKDVKVPAKLGIEKSQIKKELEKIMTAYGICGDPRHKGPEFDGKVKAIIKE